MSRIRNAYELKLGKLLEPLRPRQSLKGINWLLTKAERISTEENIPMPLAVTRVHEVTQRKIIAWLNRKNEATKRHQIDPQSVRFWCDSGLGGLARWLRALGYESFWQYHISDPELLQVAQRDNAMILTTDSLFMERRLIRDDLIPALWLPPTLYLNEQLTLVFEALHLEVRESRCMACGGELRRGDKESLRDQIPPKTYRWLDDYFVCQRCGKLFWHGTHWRKIKAQLQNLPTEKQSDVVSSR